MTNGFIILDKPTGITSRSAGARVAKMFGTKKFGHIGTLDPMASGVLVIALGEATKLIPYHASTLNPHPSTLEKEYLFSIKWGVRTDTDDITGKIVEEGGKIPTEGEIEYALPKMVGEYEQVPPAFSAKKIGGIAAYKLARQGKGVKLAPKKVRIFELTRDAGSCLVSPVSHLAAPHAVYRVRCGTGTYVRALVRDLAAKLGTIGAASMIRRNYSDGFDIKDAAPLDFLENMYNNGGILDMAAYVRPMDFGLDGIPVLNLGEKDGAAFQNGGLCLANGENGLTRAYSGGRFIGIGEVRGGVLKPKRVIKE